MKQKLLFIISCLFACHTANSQNFILYGDKTFGGNSSEATTGILDIGNNQFILSSFSATGVNGDKTTPQCDSALTGGDTWLLKIDTAFNILWNKSLGAEADEAYPVLIKAGSNKFIFSCFTQSDSACEKSEHNRDTSLNPDPDYWICMVDSNGNKIWDKTLGGTASEQNVQITQLASGNYIVAGGSISTVSGDKTTANYGFNDYWVIKMDSIGNKLWDNVYGGTNEELFSFGMSGIGLANVLPDAGDNFILAGTSDSPVSGNISDTCRGDADVWIINLDSSGNKIWDKRYGGVGIDGSAHIIHTDDKGYILCGFTDSPHGLDVSDTSKGMVDVWVIKLDSLGDKQWDNRYGGNKDDFAFWIEKALDGGYLVSGYTGSDSSFDVTESPYGILADYWIFKIDSSGNKIWDKRFGGPSVNYGTNFVLMPDSSIYLCGHAGVGTSAVKTDYGKGGSDIWVVHFKYTDNTTGINENPNQNNSISISPNPTKGKFILSTSLKEKGEVFIYDAIGKEVFIRKNVFLNHYEIDISAFSKGVYFLKVKSGEDYFLKKLVKM